MSLDEPLYPVDFKSVFFKTRNRISKNDAQIVAEHYETGMSFRDISMQFGWTTTQIRRELQRRGIKPRDSRNLATGVRALKPGKQGSSPYYGFCNFEGRIVKDPREFPVLQVIHRHWSHGKTIHQIDLELNRAKILSRTGKQWSWAALQNIVVRFDSKKIILSKGGKYEFR